MFDFMIAYLKITKKKSRLPFVIYKKEMVDQRENLLFVSVLQEEINEVLTYYKSRITKKHILFILGQARDEYDWTRLIFSSMSWYDFLLLYYVFAPGKFRSVLPLLNKGASWWHDESIEKHNKLLKIICERENMDFESLKVFHSEYTLKNKLEDLFLRLKSKCRKPIY
jgi:hypothetical protein